MNYEDRRGDWMQTLSGRRFYPIDPRPEDIQIVDIAGALSKLCRFGGHCQKFYSVAEHSVYVSQVVPEEHALCALLHDATEAYCVDIPRPLKRHLSNYADIEQRIWEAVAVSQNLPTEMPSCVKDADNNVLLAERDQVMLKTDEVWSVPGIAAKVKIKGLPPKKAEALFLARYYEIIRVMY